MADFRQSGKAPERPVKVRKKRCGKVWNVSSRLLPPGPRRPDYERCAALSAPRNKATLKKLSENLCVAGELFQAGISRQRPIFVRRSEKKGRVREKREDRGTSWSSKDISKLASFRHHSGKVETIAEIYQGVILSALSRCGPLKIPTVRSNQWLQTNLY